MDLDTLLAPLQTPRERLFVHARLRGMSEQASYLAAGGKGKVNDECFCRAPHVVQVLAAAQNISAEETGVTRAKVTEMLLAAYANAVNATEQVMAARELGKLYGHYAPATLKIKHDHQHSISDKRARIKELPLSELEGFFVIEGEFTEVKEPLQLTSG